MPTGRPHSIKCPSCKRGKWNHIPQNKGISVTDHVRKRLRGRAQAFIICKDCEHTWWSTVMPVPNGWKLKPGRYYIDWNSGVCIPDPCAKKPSSPAARRT